MKKAAVLRNFWLEKERQKWVLLLDTRVARLSSESTLVFLVVLMALVGLENCIIFSNKLA